MAIVARHDGRNHMIIYAALSVTPVAAHHAQRCCSLAHNLTLGPTPHPLAESLNSSPSLVTGLATIDLGCGVQVFNAPMQLPPRSGPWLWRVCVQLWPRSTV